MCVVTVENRPYHPLTQCAHLSASILDACFYRVCAGMRSSPTLSALRAPRPLALPRTSPTSSSPSSSLPHSSPLRLIRALHPGRHHCSLSSLTCQATVKPPRAACPILCVLPPRLGDAAAPLNFRRPAQLQCLGVAARSSAEQRGTYGSGQRAWCLVACMRRCSPHLSRLFGSPRQASSLLPTPSLRFVSLTSSILASIGVFFHWCK